METYFFYYFPTLSQLLITYIINKFQPKIIKNKKREVYPKKRKRGGDQQLVIDDESKGRWLGY